MKVRQAACPSCGAPVEFRKRSSLMAVCEFCQSVVARGDRTVEDWGKVADLVYTGSPLQLGLTGKHEGRKFEIVGHVQFRHPAGGLWDEWYVSFPNDRWGWLAEAQGRFYLTFNKPLAEKTPLPPQEELKAGRSFEFPGVGRLTVAEVGEASAAGAEGEMPFQLRPGERIRYADLYGPNGAFATFDYSESPAQCFLGKEVTLDELGIADAKPPERPPQPVAGKRLNCPQCGGPLTLHAPDKTERVACPNCAALLDVTQGDLQYLLTLRSKRVPPVVPLDSRGTIDGVEYTVIGLMERFVVYAGKKYPWTEYLLYNPQAGFRWLVHSDGHWSFVRPVSPGNVTDRYREADVDGRPFKLFQDTSATVRYVVGEFYWKVEVGEQVRVRDYIRPPEMLSIETSTSVARSEGTPTMAQEVNYSLGTYLPVDEVKQIFGLEDVRKGWGVAPNQPSPVDNWLFVYWLLFGVGLLAINVLARAIVSTEVDQGLFFIGLVLVSLVPLGALFYKFSFEKMRWSESEFSPYESE